MGTKVDERLRERMNYQTFRDTQYDTLQGTDRGAYEDSRVIGHINRTRMITSADMGRDNREIARMIARESAIDSLFITEERKYHDLGVALRRARKQAAR